jgi:hypothetical protein
VRLNVDVTRTPPVSHQGTQEWLRFRVVDDGCGVAPDKLSRIFLPCVPAALPARRQAPMHGRRCARWLRLIDHLR